MIYEVCAVYDRAAEAFSRPVFVQSTGMMVRSFSDEVNREAEDNPIFHHPEDFDLFHLGSFDDSTGRFDLLSDVRRLARADDLTTRRLRDQKGNGNGVSE